ncbi:gamma-glutamylcyclotransferase [Simiduia sp. 21SJ11W-1]|uniref:gamma-glutamylcyclotransferase family protein n=1 Tax=Simiduia sp. 21SJ11W-1 TaxID=2909669 RepID=UPI00209DB10B|nr:gamma-glutamylcyclotransferase family protein [Simiduia sp. 21SJ11W-1]UTA47651.1 gamma-glutamylcyclotransferase [Simiduia sp. 21SJ11W-1]
MTEFHVAVYGSLKQGYANHGYLHTAVRLGDYQTEPRYTLLDLGFFPALIDEGTTSVSVEIYRVSSATLTNLDRLEGHPRFYRRTERQIIGFGLAWIYIANKEALAGSHYNAIATGVWGEEF